MVFFNSERMIAAIPLMLNFLQRFGVSAALSDRACSPATCTGKELWHGPFTTFQRRALGHIAVANCARG